MTAAASAVSSPSFTGYRAHPSLLVLLVLAVYWAGVVGMLRRVSR